MWDELTNFITDKEFRFTVYENKIYIENYKRILSLEDNYVSLQSMNKKITIIGKKLTLKKLIDNEMLISGIIEKIEVRNE